MNRIVLAPGLKTIDRLWRTETDADRATRAVVLALFGTLLLWASARMQVPFFPVKMSLQSLVVMLIGAFYGSRLGARRSSPISLRASPVCRCSRARRKKASAFST